ncbi:LOW QUALITY PROTEIN: TrkH domain-containing protein, partial [Cephalotus follicularis]
LHPFCTHISYFLFISCIGFWVLHALKPRTDSFSPRNLDLFFTSVSASTVSSMSTVEMEVFSNTQLIVLTILMFIGGEVFTSMIGLQFRKKSMLKRICRHEGTVAAVPSDLSPSGPTDTVSQIELSTVTVTPPDYFKNSSQHESLEGKYLHNSIKFLVVVVAGYLLVNHAIGVVLITLYLQIVPSSRKVLKSKGINLLTFSIFTTVSTFSSCGFVPTNENMVVFAKNSGLLLILIPQILLGNTLYPPALQFSIWVLGKFVKKDESNYLLEKSNAIGYLHLLPRRHSILLVVTVFGFVAVQFILFCSLDWNSVALTGLNSYQKTIGVLFQTVNTRHTGETVVDLSIISPAILVLFVAMMYLPPYTCFMPIKDQEERGWRRSMGKIVDNLLLSPLSYLVIFIMLVCITERERMKNDPLNFSVLNIVVEVISAYGNVGFSTGYSCEQLYPEDGCEDKWYGFSGKWSDEGKIILILVMFFGRLKQFTMDGGRAWKLL